MSYHLCWMMQTSCILIRGDGPSYFIIEGLRWSIKLILTWVWRPYVYMLIQHFDWFFGRSNQKYATNIEKVSPLPCLTAIDLIVIAALTKNWLSVSNESSGFWVFNVYFYPSKINMQIRVKTLQTCDSTLNTSQKPYKMVIFVRSVFKLKFCCEHCFSDVYALRRAVRDFSGRTNFKICYFSLKNELSSISKSTRYF